jgi:hypothetical protein
MRDDRNPKKKNKRRQGATHTVLSKAAKLLKQATSDKAQAKGEARQDEGRKGGIRTPRLHLALQYAFLHYRA